MPKKQAEKTFEDQVHRLDEIVTKLESPQIALEESLVLYREGVALLAQCRERLEHARNEIALLNEDGSLSPLPSDDEPISSASY